MFGLLTNAWEAVFGKRATPDDEDAVDEAPAAKRRRTAPAEEPEIEDEAYDALKISAKDAKLLDSLGVTSLSAIENEATERQEQLDAYDELIDEVAEMDFKALKDLLKKYNVTAGKTVEAAREQAEDEICEKREALENNLASPARAFLLAMQVDWTPDMITPLPLHIFKAPYGSISTGKLEVIVPQPACLHDSGAWLKSKETKADLVLLENFYSCIQATPNAADPRDRYHVGMRSDGDASVVPLLAPLSSECKGMTQAVFEKLTEEERSEVVCSCLGLGDVLQTYLESSHDALRAIDWQVEEESERAGRTFSDVEDDWDGAVEAAMEDLVVSATGEPLHYLVTETDTMADNPYFAVGISPNGNLVGYCTNLVWT